MSLVFPQTYYWTVENICKFKNLNPTVNDQHGRTTFKLRFTLKTSLKILLMLKKLSVLKLTNQGELWKCATTTTATATHVDFNDFELNFCLTNSFISSTLVRSTNGALSVLTVCFAKISIKIFFLFRTLTKIMLACVFLSVCIFFQLVEFVGSTILLK